MISTKRSSSFVQMTPHRHLLSYRSIRSFITFRSKKKLQSDPADLRSKSMTPKISCKRREANTNGDTGDVEALPRNHKAMALNQAIAQPRHAPKLCSQLFSHAATTMNGWWWWEWSGCSSSSEVRDKKHKTGRGGHWSNRMTHEVRIARSLRSVELAVPRRPMTCTRRWTKYSQICLIPNTNQTSG